MISFTIPIRTISEANQSRQEHWGSKARRVKKQREAVAWLWPRQKIELPVTVALTRIAPRSLDFDNLVRSQKAVVDEIARQLGVDDKCIAWFYGQERGTKAKEYAVRVEIEPKSS
jgi:hypothetical protein